jgi:hypothetical protein
VLTNRWHTPQTSKPEDAVKISTGFSLQMGIFARMTQATYLLSKAIQSIQARARAPQLDDDMSTDDDNDDKTAQLRRTLLALVHTADKEATVRRLEYCSPSQLSLRYVYPLSKYNSFPGAVRPGPEKEKWSKNQNQNSVILFLQSHYNLPSRSSTNSTSTPSSADLSYASLWDETHTTLERLTVASQTCDLFGEKYAEAGEHVPVTLSNIVYQVASIMMDLKAQGTLFQGEDAGIKLDVLKRLLCRIRDRWNVAGKCALRMLRDLLLITDCDSIVGVYLNILESRELTMESCIM